MIVLKGIWKASFSFFQKYRAIFERECILLIVLFRELTVQFEYELRNYLDALFGLH